MRHFIWVISTLFFWVPALSTGQPYLMRNTDGPVIDFGSLDSHAVRWVKGARLDTVAVRYTWANGWWTSFYSFDRSGDSLTVTLTDSTQDAMRELWVYAGPQDTLLVHFKADDGDTTLERYDSLGREILSVERGLHRSCVHDIEYSDSDNLTWKSDEYGNHWIYYGPGHRIDSEFTEYYSGASTTTRNRYDEYGRLTYSATYGGSDTTNIQIVRYDRTGASFELRYTNLALKHNSRPEIESRTWRDTHGNVITYVFADRPSDTSRTSYTYDDLGRVLRRSSADYSVENTWGPNGEPLRSFETIDGTTKERLFEYRYAR